MAQAHLNQAASASIFRFENPETLDVCAIEAAAAKPQRGAWRYLASLFEQAEQQHSYQFSIEPDATVWRIRYRLVDGFDEQVLSDPSEMTWALDALQMHLWGEEYHTSAHRISRFTWANKSSKHAVTLRVIATVNGDLLQFDTEPMHPMPPLLDELLAQPAQLQTVRNRLANRRGMILITSTDSHVLDDMLVAINQELVSPDRKLLSISDRHRYNLPRTTQIGLSEVPEDAVKQSWENALNSYHDTVFINASVPEQFHEKLAEACDRGTLAVNIMNVARAADSMQMLNDRVIRRDTLHRTIDTVINHFRVNSLCQKCCCTAKLNTEEKTWLEDIRTPATKNVIDWLDDGNTEMYMHAEGCDACNDTGKGQPLNVFDIVSRDEQNNLFPTGANAAALKQSRTLQNHLLLLAKNSFIELSEVIRILKLAGY